ncbi:MAG: hypothetical protein ABSH32_11935 [Bryobacteraceae bacterium]|jgi:hypothetical protein
MTRQNGAAISSGRRSATAAAILIVSLAIAPLGCKRHRQASAQTEEDVLATIVHAADPRAASQLVSGFYAVEANAWRWTAGKFSVLLRVPRNAASKGAILQLKLTIPDVSITQEKAITLSASLNGVALAPETYTHAGEFAYRRDIPAAQLDGESVSVDFSVDKTIPPNATDKRELGVIVSEVGFQPK